MSAKFSQWAKNKASSRSGEPAAKPAGVQYDVCRGAKRKAVKSCLMCEASNCQIHLEPNPKAARLKLHQMIHPVDNLEDRVRHYKPRKLFCRTDHTAEKQASSRSAPPSKDRTQVSVPQRSRDGSVVKAQDQQEETMVKKLLESVELRWFQQFAVDVTLCPETAHPDLILSKDEKQVHDGDEWKNLPANPLRFNRAVSVLGQQRFSSGRFYYEVQVQGKTGWTLGVARESSKRRGIITLNPQKGYWTLRWRDENKFLALTRPPVHLRATSKPERIGVFVDYEDGLVSFYDVNNVAWIFSFTGCSFADTLLPFFSPGFNSSGKNSAPLIISAVDYNE